MLPFPQMGVGLANKAVDAAVVIPPWAFQLVDQNIGAVLVDVDDHVKPTPLSIAVAFINTDWARQNRELARNFFVAYIRGDSGILPSLSQRAEPAGSDRHRGPHRRRAAAGAALQISLAGRDPNGRFNMASLLDIQSWYVKAGLTQQQFPPERIATNEYVDYAVQKLGPFAVENKDSTLPGCR